MIPKIIHYCWFGGAPLGEKEKKCIESWKKFLPDYEIIEWNENNYDVSKNKYMHEAYKKGKWSFVSDYARLDVVYNYGGLYFDTDVEVIKNFDELLTAKMFCGFEGSNDGVKNLNNHVALGLGFGAEKHHQALKAMLDFYENLSFYNKDGSFNMVPCPKYQTEVLIGLGLNVNDGSCQEFSGVKVYSKEYFSPKDFLTGKVIITKNTYSIHHWAMTWLEEEDRGYHYLAWELTEKYGYKKANRIVWWKSLPYRLKMKLKKIFKK